MSGPSGPRSVQSHHASLEDPKAVENLFGRLKEYNAKEKENVISSGITKKYQENQNKAAAWLEATNEINNSKDIGPTKRLELQDSLNKDRAFIIQEQNQLNAQAKALEEQKIEREKLKKVHEEKAVKEKEVLEKNLKTEQEVFEILKAKEGEEEAKRLSKILSPKAALERVKPSKKEQALEAEEAKEIPKLRDTIAKGNDALSNIASVRKLSEEQLGGVSGYAKALLNTESAAELRNLSASSLDTVIKLFNPAGTLPVAKLNWLRDTFAASPWDTQSTIRGKLNAQEKITKQAIERANTRMKLISAPKVSKEDVQKFDSDTNAILDNLETELVPNEAKKEERPGFVKLKDKNGIERWVPEEIARKMQGEK